MFGHQERDIVVMVHGDNFVSTARNHERHHRTRWRKQEANQCVDQVHLRRKVQRHSLRTPGSDMHHESDELLVDEKIKKYQSLCARTNCLAR